MDDDGSMVIDMEMYFDTSPNITDFLFKNWNATTGAGLFAMCLAMTALSLVMEAIRTAEEYGQLKQKLSARSDAVIDRRALLPDHSARSNSMRSRRWHFTQACLMLLRVSIGYLLMLAVMSYNVWIVLTVIASSTVCYFVFSLVRQSMRWSLYKNLHADTVVDEILRSVSS